MQPVQMTQVARNMIAMLYDNDGRKIRDLTRNIEKVVSDPRKSDKIAGYDDVFIARADNYRVIFRRNGDLIRIESVSREAPETSQPLP